MRGRSARRVGIAGTVLILTAALLVGPTPRRSADAVPKDKEEFMLRLINRARAERGIPKLKMWDELEARAHRHSVRMAEDRSIYHTACLSCQSPNDGWTSMGENVGRGGWLKGIHGKFMRSPAHAANILCSCFKRVGLGIVRSSGQTYVTQLFWG